MLALLNKILGRKVFDVNMDLTVLTLFWRKKEGVGWISESGLTDFSITDTGFRKGCFQYFIHCVDKAELHLL
jgi:hypothetical protein